MQLLFLFFLTIKKIPCTSSEADTLKHMGIFSFLAFYVFMYNLFYPFTVILWHIKVDLNLFLDFSYSGNTVDPT